MWKAIYSRHPRMGAVTDKPLTALVTRGPLNVLVLCGFEALQDLIAATMKLPEIIGIKKVHSPFLPARNSRRSSRYQHYLGGAQIKVTGVQALLIERREEIHLLQRVADRAELHNAFAQLPLNVRTAIV